MARIPSSPPHSRIPADHTVLVSVHEPSQQLRRNRWKETLGIEADIQLLELYQMLGETAESSTQTALVSEVEVEEIQVRELAHGEAVPDFNDEGGLGISASTALFPEKEEPTSQDAGSQHPELMAGSLWRLLRAAHHMPRLVSLVVANCAELVASEPFLMQQDTLRLLADLQLLELLDDCQSWGWLHEVHIIELLSEDSLMPLTQLSSLRAELRDQRFRKVSLALALKPFPRLLDDLLDAWFVEASTPEDLAEWASARAIPEGLLIQQWQGFGDLELKRFLSMTPELSESLGAELRRSRGVDAALDAELLHQLWRLRIASFYELFSSLLTTLLRPLGCPRRVLMRRFGLSLRPRRWRMGVRFWVLELRHGLDAIHSLWVALDFLLQAPGPGLWAAYVRPTEMAKLGGLGAVESAFETILGDGVQVQVTLLSRTDKGVRADGNYMAAILPNGTEFLGEDDRSASLCKLVNQCLKDRGHHAFVDLLQPLPEKYRFHWEDRRFLSQMSKSKSYEYFLVPECDFDSSGFGNSKGFLAWHVPWSFDVGAREAMQLAAGRLVGQHDFSAFTSQHGRDKESIRCLTSLQIDEVLAVPRESWPAQEVLRIRVTGESFLYRMVRYLVYALVLIGRGELMLRNLERVLVGSYRGWHRRRLHLKPAPSHGLRLAELQLDPDV
ncbi:tRNA pseudouridine synthase A 1 (tRNA pseudouridine(38-40) synthase) (tRNA pseudouridylate synthase I 1) (tRNA-uridine isomerase I 1) [Durusdinium trenchii]|uniref:tRNA pseudouridine synthase A 1 (tRNA pseudouridine(38-40) synthase) (tRNA pseudouridylate synthase I 1) (tRNA-uridine isomerase I 1) n=1 Tax=Durusdinium trenchii TaxID=1381693 RepID=A0ABP0RWR2_9DINO